MKPLLAVIQQIYTIYAHDIKVGLANIAMLITGFADIDVPIKIMTFILGAVYTIQRIWYNWEERRDKKNKPNS